MGGKINYLWNNTKILETQVTQTTSTSLRALEWFPSQREANLVEHCNTITLRSDNILKEPKKSNDDQMKKECTPNKGEHEKTTEEPQPKASVRAYIPPIPFPQRLGKAKLDEHFGIFIKRLTKLVLDIPFFTPWPNTYVFKIQEGYFVASNKDRRLWDCVFDGGMQRANPTQIASQTPRYRWFLYSMHHWRIQDW